MLCLVVGKKCAPIHLQINVSTLESLYQSRHDGVRRQYEFPPSFQFPCPTAARLRSPQRPSSVHRLRPGDVDVVGAMGDSLVAGNGALEEYALGTIVEYRGVSWAAGECRAFTISEVFIYMASVFLLRSLGHRRSACFPPSP